MGVWNSVSLSTSFDVLNKFVLTINLGNHYIFVYQEGCFGSLLLVFKLDDDFDGNINDIRDI